MAHPTLTEMGISRPNEISHYTLRQEGDRNDVLRIHYERAPGSLRPISRKYRFGRAVKTSIVDSGSGRMEDSYEFSPKLQTAIEELEQLVSRKQESGDRKAQLIVGLDRLEKDFESRIGELRAQINSL